MNRTATLEGRAMRALSGLLPASLALAVLSAGLLVPAASSQSSAAPAQSSSAAAATLPTPVLERRGVDIESSQPDAHEEYLLGGGDEISISVAGRAELSGVHTVGPDGRITLPMIGSVDVGEKSRDDAARAIDAALGKYYSGKVVSTVQVTKYGSNHILLLGAVEHTGVISFDQPPTLLEAITRGGALVSSDKSASGGTPRRCVVYRGENQVMNVNISERLDGQKALNNIRLRRNDIIYIPEHQTSLVSVLGEVEHPGPVTLKGTTTLASLLAESGGITPQAGNPDIQIVEPSSGRVQRIKFKELLKPQGGTDVTLHDGDIIYVPRSGLAKVGFVLGQIAPLASMGTVATFAMH